MSGDVDRLITHQVYMSWTDQAAAYQGWQCFSYVRRVARESEILPTQI